MWTMPNLITYINKIKLRIDAHNTTIDEKITDIQGLDASHIKYGATLPIIPRLTFYTIETGGLTTHHIGHSKRDSLRLLFPKDDEIILSSSIWTGESRVQYIRRVDPINLIVGDITVADSKIRVHPLHLEYIGSSYYGMGWDGMGYQYNDDFSTETTFSPAEAFSADFSKNTFETNKIVIYKNLSKFTLNLDGTLDSEVAWTPQDRLYHKGIDIGNEVWNHRFIQTLYESGNVYFLDKLLVPIYGLTPAKRDQHQLNFRKIGNYIYFARLIGENGATLHITRLELI